MNAMKTAMRTNVMLLLAAASIAGATAPAPAAAPDRRPMVVTNLAGSLHIEQGIPCNNTVDQTTPVQFHATAESAAPLTVAANLRLSG